MTESIRLEKWHLAADGTITAWVPQKLHHSKSYAPLKDCYTGRTHGLHLYSVSVDGRSEVDGISVEYEYSIPLTHLKQRAVKWQWQGLYNAGVVEFNLEQHIQETTPAGHSEQTLKQLTDIISNLNLNATVTKYHNFKISQGIVLCQHCGELLEDLKKLKMPGCLAL